MRLENLEAASPLRLFGEEIWAFVEGLGATVDQPRGASENHLGRRDEVHFLSFRFTEEKARKFPQYSLVLYAEWCESFRGIPGIKKGLRTWHDRPSAEIGVRPGQGDVARQFIQVAYDQADSKGALAKGRERGK